MNKEKLHNDFGKILLIHSVLVQALGEYAREAQDNDDNIAAHSFAAIILLGYQINRDFAKGNFSDAIKIAEPMAVLLDQMLRPEQSPSEQAVS